MTPSLFDLYSILNIFPLQFHLLTERRARAPRGARGGGDASTGRNLLIRAANNAATTQATSLTGSAAVAEVSGDGDAKPACVGASRVAGAREVVSLGARASLWLNPGDEIVVMTPGGGGYGYLGKCTCSGKSEDEVSGENVCECVRAARARVITEDDEIARAIQRTQQDAGEDRDAKDMSDREDQSDERPVKKQRLDVSSEAAKPISGLVGEDSGVAATVRLTGGSVNQWALDQEQV